MGQAEPAPLLQPLCGCWCALNQLSYKCQPSPYSRTRPPTRGSWGSAGQCPVPLCARLRRTCRPLVLRARGSLPLPLTSQSQEPSPPFFRHWRHSASVPTLQKKKKMALRHPLSKNKTPILQLLLYPSLFSNPCCSMESRVNLQHCNTNRLKEIPFCCATQFNRSNNPSVKRTVRGILAPLNSF